MNATIGGLVSILVEGYLAEAKKLQSAEPRADSGGALAEGTRDSS